MPEMLRKLGKIASFAPMLLPYLWYHKVVFGVTNTKFDISFCVFRESFLADQYRIREFIGKLDQASTLFFLDLGRNHGFVFYYMMHHIMRTNFPVKTIDYFGIDPSPLKFVYFNHFGFLRKKAITINYYLIDKAMVFDNSQYVKLKYGEQNFGNFNVSGSNYHNILADKQSRFTYAEINVETIRLEEIKNILRKYGDADAIIVKIDCKNRTDCIFAECLAMMEARDRPYLVSCERDGSSGRDLSRFAQEKTRTLCASNLLP